MTIPSFPTDTSPNAELVHVTPAMASKWLEKNYDNRDQRKSRIDALATAMQNDQFVVTTDCIGFDITGRLVNGQHRLEAVVKSEKSVWMLVAYNLSSNAFAFTDRGVGRTLSDITNKSKIQVANFRHALYGYAQTTNAKWKYLEANGELFKYLMTHNSLAEGWYTIDTEINKYPKARSPYFTASVCSAVIRAAWAHPDKLDSIREFIEKYANGDQLPKDSPILALREYVQREKQGRTREQMRKTHGWTQKVISMWFTNESMKEVKRSNTKKDFSFQGSLPDYDLFLLPNDVVEWISSVTVNI